MKLGKLIAKKIMKGYKLPIPKIEKLEVREETEPQIISRPEEVPAVEETPSFEVGLRLPQIPTELTEIKVEKKPLIGKAMTYPLIPKKPAKGEPIFAYAKIFWDAVANRYVYQLVEPQPTSDILKMFKKIKDLLEEKLDIDFTKLKKIEAKDYLSKQMDEIIKVFHFQISENDKQILKYYIERDFTGLGKIEPLMQDPNIEDISCDGLNVPIFVFHRDPNVGSIITNIVFDDPDELDSFIIRLAQLCGKSISVARPLLEGSLPDGSRLQATLATDIARRGSNFSIRRFSEEPLTPTHLLNYGTTDIATLAYLWFVVDYGRSVIVSGGTASGKTTFLNILSLFIRPEKKIVCTVYDSKLILANGTTKSIGDLIENEGKKHGYVRESNQIQKIKPNPGITLLSFDMDRFSPVFNSVNSAYKILPQEDLIRIITNAGCELEITPTTQIPTLTENGIEFLESHKIKVGNYIPQSTKVTIKPKQSRISLIQAFKNTDLRIVVSRKFWDDLKRSYKCKYFSELAKKLGVRYESQLKPWINGGSVQFKDVLNWSKGRIKFIEYIEKFGSRCSPELPKLMTPELAYLLGLVCTDGSLYSDKVTVELCSRDDKLLTKRLKKIVKKVFNISIFRNSLYGKTFWYLFKNVFGIEPHKSKNVRVPTMIMQSSNDCISSFIAGVIDGDGCIDVKGRKIIIEMSSEKFIEDLHYLFLRLGIFSTISKNEELKGYKTGPSHILQIGGEYLRKSLESIGCKINKNIIKKEGLKKIIREQKNRFKLSDDILPFVARTFTGKILKRNGLLYPVYKNFGKKTECSFYPTNRSSVSRSTLSNILYRYNSILEKDADYGNLKKLVKMHNIRWVRVKRCERIPSSNFVYDLSMKNNIPWYLTGKNGFIICHNSIEDTPELRLPHTHWVPSVARTPISTEGLGEIDLFELLKGSLRQRPDYIVVGEVRGKEAYILFQQMAMGHPSIATIHAENTSRLIDRLTTPPISLPPTLIKSVDTLIFLARMRYKEKFTRKVVEVLEIVDFDIHTNSPIVNTVFKWNPLTDTFDLVNTSILLKRFSKLSGMDENEIRDEIERRMLVLSWMEKNNITDYRDVYKILSVYYSDPHKLLLAIRGGRT